MSTQPAFQKILRRSRQKKYLFRSLTRVILVTFVFNNVAFAHKPETSIWEERHKQKELMLASLPNAAAPILPGSSLSTFSPALLGPSPKMNFEETSLNKTRTLGSTLLPETFFSHVTVRKVKHSQNPATVLILEDIHQNLEAQTHLSSALKSLGSLSGNGAIPVGLEGAHGGFVYEAYKGFPEHNIASQVADDFLKSGQISGPAHAGFTSYKEEGKRGLFFWGVDDPPLYNENVQAYRNSSRVKPEVKGELTSLKKKLTQEKKRILNPALNEFDRVVEAHRNETLSLGAYVEKLNQYGVASSLTVDTFLQAYQTESKINFEQVEREKKVVIEKLVKTLKQADLEKLIQLSLGYQEGQVSFAGYYGELRKIAQSHGIDLTKVPQFNSYIQYLLLADGVNAEVLLKDVQTWEEKVYGSLMTNETERSLIAQSRRIYLMEQLVEFAMTSDQWSEYSAVRASQRLAPTLKPFESFYLCADGRNKSMVSNLPKQNSNLTVIVAGGYHTAGLTALLEKQGLSYIVASPKVTKIDLSEGTKYLSVFDREKTPLANLFAGKKLFMVFPVSGAARPISKDFPDTRTSPMVLQNLARLASDNNLHGDSWACAGRILRGLPERANVVHKEGQQNVSYVEFVGPKTVWRIYLQEKASAVVQFFWKGQGSIFERPRIQSLVWLTLSLLIGFFTIQHFDFKNLLQNSSPFAMVPTDNPISLIGVGATALSAVKGVLGLLNSKEVGNYQSFRVFGPHANEKGLLWFHESPTRLLPSSVKPEKINLFEILRDLKRDEKDARRIKAMKLVHRSFLKKLAVDKKKEFPEYRFLQDLTLKGIEEGHFDLEIMEFFGAEEKKREFHASLLDQKLFSGPYSAFSGILGRRDAESAHLIYHVLLNLRSILFSTYLEIIETSGNTNHKILLSPQPNLSARSGGLNSFQREFDQLDTLGMQPHGNRVVAQINAVGLGETEEKSLEYVVSLIDHAMIKNGQVVNITNVTHPRVFVHLMSAYLKALLTRIGSLENALKKRDKNIRPEKLKEAVGKEIGRLSQTMISISLTSIPGSPRVSMTDIIGDKAPKDLDRNIAKAIFSLDQAFYYGKRLPKRLKNLSFGLPSEMAGIIGLADLVKHRGGGVSPAPQLLIERQTQDDDYYNKYTPKEGDKVIEALLQANKEIDPLFSTGLRALAFQSRVKTAQNIRIQQDEVIRKLMVRMKMVLEEKDRIEKATSHRRSFPHSRVERSLDNRVFLVFIFGASLLLDLIGWFIIDSQEPSYGGILPAAILIVSALGVFYFNGQWRVLFDAFTEAERNHYAIDESKLHFLIRNRNGVFKDMSELKGVDTTDAVATVFGGYVYLNRPVLCRMAMEEQQSVINEELRHLRYQRENKIDSAILRTRSQIIWEEWVVNVWMPIADFVSRRNAVLTGFTRDEYETLHPHSPLPAYHGVLHSLNVIKFARDLAWAFNIGSIPLEGFFSDAAILKQSFPALFTMAAELHDIDLAREPGTLPRVPVTLNWLAAHKSELMKRYGLNESPVGEIQFHIVTYFIQRTDYPYSQDSFNANKAILSDIKTQLTALGVSVVDLKDILLATIRNGALLSEYADQASYYSMSDNTAEPLRTAVQALLGLANETGRDLRVLEAVTFIKKIGHKSKFEFDFQMAKEFLENYPSDLIPSLTEVFSRLGGRYREVFVEVLFGMQVFYDELKSRKFLNQLTIENAVEVALRMIAMKPVVPTRLEFTVHKPSKSDSSIELLTLSRDTAKRPRGKFLKGRSDIQLLATVAVLSLVVVAVVWFFHGAPFSAQDIKKGALVLIAALSPLGLVMSLDLESTRKEKPVENRPGTFLYLYPPLRGPDPTDGDENGKIKYAMLVFQNEIREFFPSTSFKLGPPTQKTSVPEQSVVSLTVEPSSRLPLEKQAVDNDRMLEFQFLDPKGRLLPTLRFEFISDIQVFMSIGEGDPRSREFVFLEFWRKVQGVNRGRPDWESLFEPPFQTTVELHRLFRELSGQTVSPVGHSSDGEIKVVSPPTNPRLLLVERILSLLIAFIFFIPFSSMGAPMDWMNGVREVSELEMWVKQIPWETVFKWVSFVGVLVFFFPWMVTGSERQTPVQRTRRKIIYQDVPHVNKSVGEVVRLLVATAKVQPVIGNKGTFDKKHLTLQSYIEQVRTTQEDVERTQSLQLMERYFDLVSEKQLKSRLQEINSFRENSDQGTRVTVVAVGQVPTPEMLNEDKQNILFAVLRAGTGNLINGNKQVREKVVVLLDPSMNSAGEENFMEAFQNRILQEFTPEMRAVVKVIILEKSPEPVFDLDQVLKTNLGNMDGVNQLELIARLPNKFKMSESLKNILTRIITNLGWGWTSIEMKLKAGNAAADKA